MGSFGSDLLMALEEIAEKHGIDTDEENEIPQTVDELKARTPTIQLEFAKALEAEAAKKRGEQW